MRLGRRRAPAAGLWLALASGSGCDPDPDEPAASTEHDDGPEGTTTDAALDVDPIPLATATQWQLVDAQDDPLAFERPEDDRCPAAAFSVEGDGLEIQTGVCHYFFATQPAATALVPGDELEVLVFHAGLDAAEPAQGHVALLLDDQVVWERWVPIPAEATVFDERIRVDEAWPPGTAVGLHLHNHGFNAWTVLSIERLPAAG